jgi:hypothetical protein
VIDGEGTTDARDYFAPYVNHRLFEVVPMRSALGFCLLTSGLLIVLSVAAFAAPVNHRRARQHIMLRPNLDPVTPRARPGWYSFPGYPAIPPEENRNLDPSTRGSG